MSIHLDKSHPHYSANKELESMKYLDLQAACISRGMLFEDVVAADRPKLESWFVRNFTNKRNKGLLEDFDIWVDKQLSKKYAKDDPIRLYRRFSALLEDGSVQVTSQASKKAKIHKERKPKRARINGFNIFEGTKKAFTYHLSKDLFSKLGEKYNIKQLQKNFADKLVSRVKEKYPDAQDKSVRIWMSRALKELDGQKKKV